MQNIPYLWSSQPILLVNHHDAKAQPIYHNYLQTGKYLMYKSLATVFYWALKGSCSFMCSLNVLLQVGRLIWREGKQIHITYLQYIYVTSTTNIVTNLLADMLPLILSPPRPLSPCCRILHSLLLGMESHPYHRHAQPGASSTENKKSGSIDVIIYLYSYSVSKSQVPENTNPWILWQPATLSDQSQNSEVHTSKTSGKTFLHSLHA